MTYQDTEIIEEAIATNDLRCWIELQCHSRESVRGWAFRVGGSGISRTMNWQYGYPSQDEARARAIDVIEEWVKHNIRQAEKQLKLSRCLLEEVHKHQRSPTLT